MSITVAGVFDQQAQATQACERLQAAGIPKEVVNLSSEGTSPSMEVAAAPVGDQSDRRGFFAKLFGLGDDDDESSSHYAEAVRRGNAVVTVQVADEARVDEISAILEEAGAVDVNERVEQWKASGYAPTAMAGRPMAEPDAQTLKAVEEDLNVGKRVVQKGRVRIHQTLQERPVEEHLTLRDETASIERKPVDRPATEADVQGAFKDQEIEIRETSEQPVVSKTARVVEEVRIGTKATERTETVRDTVRSTKVEVEEMGNTEDTKLSLPVYSGVERRIGGSARHGGPERRVAVH